MRFATHCTIAILMWVGTLLSTWSASPAYAQQVHQVGDWTINQLQDGSIWLITAHSDGLGLYVYVPKQGSRIFMHVATAPSIGRYLFVFDERLQESSYFAVGDSEIRGSFTAVSPFVNPRPTNIYTGAALYFVDPPVRLLNAMRKGQHARFRFFNNVSNNAVDGQFSLRGFAEAFDRSIALASNTYSYADGTLPGKSPATTWAPPNIQSAPKPAPNQQFNQPGSRQSSKHGGPQPCPGRYSRRRDGTYVVSNGGVKRPDGTCFYETVKVCSKGSGVRNLAGGFVDCEY